jgi:hypothetical protein
MIKASADMTAGLTVQVLKVFNTEAVGWPSSPSKRPFLSTGILLYALEVIDSGDLQHVSLEGLSETGLWYSSDTYVWQSLLIVNGALVLRPQIRVVDSTSPLSYPKRWSWTWRKSEWANETWPVYMASSKWRIGTHCLLAAGRELITHIVFTLVEDAGEASLNLLFGSARTRDARIQWMMRHQHD